MTDTPTPPAMTPEQRAEFVAWLRRVRMRPTVADQLEADGETIATLTAERDAAQAEMAARIGSAREVISRLTKINVKLCADFNLMNQHGAKQDAEIARLTAALATPDQIAALAAVRAATVTVKPLVWEDIAPRHSKAALPLFGSIRAESWGGDYSVVWSVPGMCDTFTHGKWATLDAAQAAAQADYDARIRAAITITSGASPDTIAKSDDFVSLPRAEAADVANMLDLVADWMEKAVKDRRIIGPEFHVPALRKALAIIQEHMK